jgi:hypothetical protein
VKIRECLQLNGESIEEGNRLLFSARLSLRASDWSVGKENGPFFN